MRYRHRTLYKIIGKWLEKDKRLPDIHGLYEKNKEFLAIELSTKSIIDSS